MRLINAWQYRYIEKSLYNYEEISMSGLPTDVKMTKAIETAMDFFKGQAHEKIINEYYFKANERKKRIKISNFFLNVCDECYISTNIGYSIRREIVYRVAMNCYALGLIKLEEN